MLQQLACEFFIEFSRYEYCLKACGILINGGHLKADWNGYSDQVRDVIENPSTPELNEAIHYFEEHPPKKQIYGEKGIMWSEKLPSSRHRAELILLLVCRVRNNLFHGGKFNGNWFEPERSEQLIRHALTILRACAEKHAGVKDAYENKHF